MWFWIGWVLVYIGIAYYSCFYYVTDPSIYALEKITIVYGILSLGLWVLSPVRYPVWFILYIVVVYVSIWKISQYVLKILETSL